MLNRIAQKIFFLFLCCLILSGTAHGADEHWTEAIKKDLREHNEYTGKNDPEATKKRLETEGLIRFADWKKAAEEGIPEGQVLLAVCYHYGVHVSGDHKEVMKWIRKAAEQGNAVGQYQFALCYFLGVGISEDKAEAAPQTAAVRAVKRISTRG